MKLAIDVQYLESTAYIAGVAFETWSAETPYAEYTSYLEDIEDYQSGFFYKRELPCIRKLLDDHQIQPDVIVIDGYVYLDGTSKPGLGKYLYDSLEQKADIIGVAKKEFTGIHESHRLFRGSSKKPLYITSTNPLEESKDCIASMFGNSRMPVLLKRADQLCREFANKSSSGRLNYD